MPIQFKDTILGRRSWMMATLSLCWIGGVFAQPTTQEALCDAARHLQLGVEVALEAPASDDALATLDRLWRELPPHFKAAAVLRIRHGVDNGNDPSLSKVGERLDTELGRALALLERLTRQRVPQVAPWRGKDEPPIDLAAARAIVDAYVQGLCDANTQAPKRLTIEQLKAKYAGTIKPLVPGPNEQRFGAFIEEFQPLGKSLRQMEDVCGLKGIAAKDSALGTIVEYRFGGLSGVIYCVIVRGDTIVGVLLPMTS